jgi:hypothetical protein
VVDVAPCGFPRHQVKKGGSATETDALAAMSRSFDIPVVAVTVLDTPLAAEREMKTPGRLVSSGSGTDAREARSGPVVLARPSRSGEDH